MICMITRLPMKRKRGAIILEAIISFPLILILSACLLTSVNCVTADILFEQSVDQVTQEISLAIPIASGGIDVLEEATSFACENIAIDVKEETSKNIAKVGGEVLSAIDAVSSILDVDGEDIIGTVAFGEWTRDRIVTVYETLTDNNKIVCDRIDHVSVVIDFEGTDHIIYLHVFYTWNTGMKALDKETDSAIPIYGDLSFSLAECNHAEDDIWMKSNFVRGRSISRSFGGNLPYSYPVIAKWSNQTATSIKSIDLTAPTYQTSGIAEETINEYIHSLELFNGTLNPWGKDATWIKEEDILEKCMIIVIPENTPDTILSEINSCYSYAASCGITLQVETFGESNKYIEEEDSET